MNPTGPRRPATRAGFEIAVICALPIEADAVDALFDHHWDDDGPPYDKAAGDPNAYSAGAVGRHNVVLAHMPGMGKASAAAVAAHCRASFLNIKLALIVGVCGVVPFRPGSSGASETVLGDVIVSDSVVQYDLGRRLPKQFEPKDTLLDALGRPNTEIRALLAKLKGLRGRKMLQGKMADYMDVLQDEPELAAMYPGATQDRLFEATYRHIADGMSCEECGCDGKLVPRTRLEQGDGQPAVHFGLIASGDTVMKSGEDRDNIARQAGVIGFEMEGAGVWDVFPCVVIKGACDYADSHKNKAWQRYAAATAAACMKAFLGYCVPSVPGSLPLPEQPTGPWFLVPYTENMTFIGRESILNQLQQQLLGPAPKIALFGLGGVGKTQIALAYIYWLRRTRPEVSVFWVHASNAERFRQAYASIAQECQVPGYDDPKADVLLLVKAWLERNDCGQWLMVIDNADDMQLFFGQHMGPVNASSSSHKEGLGRYLPECRHGTILVTTRNKQAGSRLTKGKRPIEVEKMDEGETDRLLRAHLNGISVDFSESSAFSVRLEHLPLALVQAAAFIQENTIDVGQYLELLENSDQDLVDLLSEEFEIDGRDSETPRAVAETWILSFEQIQRQNAFTGELLSLMSPFDRQAIPLEFLSRYSEQRGQEQTGGIQLTKALGVLKAFSFVVEEKDHGLDMHRLVQLVTRKWLVKNGRMRHFSGQALLVVSHCYPFGRYENWAKCSAYLAHAYALLGGEGTGSRDEKAGRATLLHSIAGFFMSRGQWKDAERFQAEAVELREEVLGADHPGTLISIGNLALIYQNQGRWEEAEKLEVQVMETFKTKLGANHPDTLASMGNLASTYRNQGRWKEAEKLEVQVMETHKTKFGPDHPDTLISIGNLALTYKDQGQWGEAEKLEVQVMETRKTKLGPDHPDTLTSMGNLASTYRNQGRWKEAEKLEVQVMETRKTKLGPDHPDTLISIGNLAFTYKNHGRWEEAEKLEVQVMETRKTKFGPDHPHTLASISHLASTYRNQGRWEEAEKLEVQVMETRKTKFGPDHPDTLASIGNLASTFRNQGRWEEAEKLEVQVIETFKTKLGANHPHTLTSMGNLASTYRNQGRWKEAEKLEVQVIETFKTKLGPDHPNTLITIGNLALTYKDQGQWEEAEKLEVQVMETRKTKLGPDHPDTLITMGNLAWTYKSQGRWEEAVKLEVQVMETFKTKLGANHPCTLTSMGNLASTYRKQGRWEEAEKLEVQVIETFKTKLGANHPHALTSMGNLASTYRNQGRWNEAEKLEVQVMETRKTKLGPDHPDTLISIGNLALTYKSQGRWEEAEKLEVQVMETRKTKFGPIIPTR